MPLKICHVPKKFHCHFNLTGDEKDQFFWSLLITSLLINWDEFSFIAMRFKNALKSEINQTLNSSSGFRMNSKYFDIYSGAPGRDTNYEKCHSAIKNSASIWRLAINYIVFLLLLLLMLLQIHILIWFRWNSTHAFPTTKINFSLNPIH